MRNSSAEKGDRPTLPSIWDILRDELLEPASGHNFQGSSSSVHQAPVRYDNRQDHRLTSSESDRQGLSLSAGENAAFLEHQVPDAAGLAFSIPQPYYHYSPREVDQTHGDHHDLGTSPHHTTPSADASTDSSLGHQTGFSRLLHLSVPSDRLAFDRTNPGAHYATFRGFPSPESHDESIGKYECQYCGKAFTRPSTLRTHLNSHTGEKPFVCPVEDCARGFSVLSNMRRHAARVHAQPTTCEDTMQLSGGDISPRDQQ